MNPPPARHERRTGVTFSIFICCILVLTGAGCDTNVTPVLGTDASYTLFGLFSPQLDTQRVLVFPIENELQPLPDEPLDARFTSTNLADQDVVVWNDSLIRQPNGGFNHLFWSPFRAEFGQVYQIMVQNEEGAATEVTVRVPPEAELVPQEPDLLSDAIFPVLVEGDVPNIFKVEVVYGFEYALTGPGETIDTWIISQDERVTKTDEGWLIRINLSKDFVTIRDVIRSLGSLDLNRGIGFMGMLLRLVAANEEWDPPGGEFDPDVLVQPGTMSNVENGFGFVGAGYRLQRNFVPADSILREAGYRLNFMENAGDIR